MIFPNMYIALSGCQNFTSMDGIWKLRYPICMYPVKTTVAGFEALNFPDVPTPRTVKGVHSVRIIAELQRQVEFPHRYGISYVNIVDCPISVVRG